MSPRSIEPIRTHASARGAAGSAFAIALLILAVAARSAADGMSALPRSNEESVLELAPGAALALYGDSTLHSYSAKAANLSVSIHMDLARTGPTESVEALFRGRAIRSVDLVVPVSGLSSGESGLDANLRAALRADTNRSIALHINSYDLRAPNAADAAFSVELHGQLSVAGVERDVTVVADGFAEGSAIRLTGNTDLLMSDYRVEVPVLLGMLKVNDRVTIQFALTIRRKS